jgi:hypothetical protein
MSRKKRDAAYYEAHKDDETLWGEPEAPAQEQPRRGLAATITVRFSVDEAERIRRVAEESGVTYSEVVRRAVQSFTQPRFTVEDGVVLRPLVGPIDATRQAEQVVELAFEHRNTTLTSTASEPHPAHR